MTNQLRKKMACESTNAVSEIFARHKNSISMMKRPFCFYVARNDEYGIGGRIMDRRCMEIYPDRLRCVWWPNSKNRNDLSKDRMHTFSEYRETVWIFSRASLEIDMKYWWVYLFINLIYIFYNSCSFYNFCIKLLIFIP